MMAENEANRVSNLKRNREEEELSSISSFLSFYSNAAAAEFPLGQLPALQTISPEKNIQTKDKISKTLLDDHLINQGEQLLRMEKTASVSMPVTTKVNISLDMDQLLQDGSISHPIVDGYEFSYYDKCVFIRQK